MSHPGSEIYPSKLVTLEYTNHFSSPYVFKNFKPQFKLETKDSTAEDHPINPNQGDTVDRYKRSSQEISEDFESKFRGPPQADKESRKKEILVGEVMDSTKEPKWPKTKAYTRKSLNYPITGVYIFPEAGKEVSAAGNEISTAGNGILRNEGLLLQRMRSMQRSSPLACRRSFSSSPVPYK
ncbi:hypothetical protein CsatB_017504 [Cannabis sativa]